MQEAEALVGPSLQLTCSPLTPGRDSPQPSCNGLVCQASVQWPLKSSSPQPPGWDEAANLPRKGTFNNFHTSSAWRGLFGHQHKGTMCT